MIMVAMSMVGRPRWKNMGEVSLGEPGHYFVLGDHRNNSLDSRAWGLVPASHVKGRAVLIWWSFPEDDGAHPTVSQRLKAWGGKIVGFFTKTRWNRCLKRIN